MRIAFFAPPDEPREARRRLHIGDRMRALMVSDAGSAVSVDTEPMSEPLLDTQSGVAEEFEQRLADCSQLAFRVAMGVLRNREDAEDVAQEAFIRAYRNFDRLRDRERFRGWLARIAWRLALDRIRASGRRERRELASLQGPPEPSVEDVAASSEFQTHLSRAMEELPEKLRKTLVLAAVEGHDLQEVGRLMGLPEGTVKSRLFLARKKLAEKLQWVVRGTKKG
jgi:RNA polymerase sigma-70 factor (ECF subfamily)